MPLIPNSRGGQALSVTSRLPQTQMMLPSPEPLARVIASMGTKSSGQQSKSKYDLDFDAFPEQKKGLMQQIMIQEMADNAVKQEGYKRLTQEYNGNYAAFLEGEKKKGKDGYDALRMQLRMGEIQIQGNIQTLEDNYKIWHENRGDAETNDALMDYVVNPNTGDRIPFKDQEGNILGYPKVGDYFDSTWETLGFDTQGNAMRYQPIDTQKPDLWNEFIRKQATLATGFIRNRYPENLFVTDAGGNMKLNYSGDDLMNYLVWFDVLEVSNREQVSAAMEGAMKYMGRNVVKDMNQEWWRFKDTNGYDMLVDRLENKYSKDISEADVKYTWMVERVQTLMKPVVQERKDVIPRLWHPEGTGDQSVLRRNYTQLAIIGQVEGGRVISVEPTGNKRFGVTTELPSQYVNYPESADDFTIANLRLSQRKDRGIGVKPSQYAQEGLRHWKYTKDSEGNTKISFEETYNKYFVTEKGAYNLMAGLPENAVIHSIGPTFQTMPRGVPILNEEGKIEVQPYCAVSMAKFFSQNKITDKKIQEQFDRQFSEPIWTVQTMVEFMGDEGINLKDLVDYKMDEKNKDNLELKGMREESLSNGLLSIYLPVTSNFLMSLSNPVYDKSFNEYVERYRDSQSGISDDAALEFAVIK